MAPKSDKKFPEVFDAAEKAGQFLQNKKNIIGGLVLGAATTPLGLPANEIVGGIKNTVGNIQAASSFANSNPQIQNILNNEYTGLAAGLNPVAGAAYMFGKGSQLAPVASKAVSDFFETTKTKKPESKKTYPTVAELQTIKPSRDYQKEKEIETNSNNTATGPRLDPNATERYASNFKAGQANMSDIQEMYADRKDLQEWAKANPALAQKEYSKAMGKEKAADMAAYAEDYGSPMNQQSEMIFEQGKPTVTTTSQFDVLNKPSELSVPGKSAYDLAMANTNFIGQQDIPETDNTQEFLTAQMKRLGLVK